MKKFKYLFIVLVLVIIVIAFKFPQLLRITEIGKKINEITEINHAAEISEVLNKFDTIYSANIEQSGAVGGAVVITYKGQVAFLKCFGVKKLGENNPVDENTVFRLASVSKTITGVLAGILDEQNAISLDDKVVDYLPEFKLKFPENTGDVKVRHLLSHTTGITPHAFDMMVEDKVPLEKILPRLNEVEIVAPPGLYYAYQNVMYSLYDPVTCVKTKKSFQEILNEKVFKPFGMKDASSDFESFEKNENKAYPHVKNENGFVPVKLNDRYYVTIPAAGINASISDMAQFLKAISGKDNQLFSQTARNMVFTPQIETVLKRTYYRNWDKIDSKHYAIGWRIINYKNHKIAQHSGYVLGYQAEIAVCDSEEIGIAVLSNSPNSFFSENVPAFLNLFFEHKNKQETEKQAAL